MVITETGECVPGCKRRLMTNQPIWPDTVAGYNWAKTPNKGNDKSHKAKSLQLEDCNGLIFIANNRAKKLTLVLCEADEDLDNDFSVVLFALPLLVDHDSPDLIVRATQTHTKYSTTKKES